MTTEMLGTHVCEDCGRIGTTGFTPSAHDHYKCRRRRFCASRSHAKTINKGWR
jgi:hypothetical protein